MIDNSANATKKKTMSKFIVYGVCCADDRKLKYEGSAVKYAEKLGDKCEAIYEITEDGEKILRDDLL